MKMRIRLGPVTNGLENSPTGSKDRYIQVLATMPVIASTGAMLIVGHEAPCRFSGLSLPNQIPRLHIAKEGNSGQVSGTSDASKTQLGLIRTRFLLSSFFSAPCSHVVVGRLARRLHLQVGRSATNKPLQQIERRSALVID